MDWSWIGHGLVMLKHNGLLIILMHHFDYVIFFVLFDIVGKKICAKMVKLARDRFGRYLSRSRKSRRGHGRYKRGRIKRRRRRGRKRRRRGNLKKVHRRKRRKRDRGGHKKKCVIGKSLIIHARQKMD